MFDRAPATIEDLVSFQDTFFHSHLRSRRICYIVLTEMHHSRIEMLIDKEVQNLVAMGYTSDFLDAFGRRAARYLSIGATVLDKKRYRSDLRLGHMACAVSLQVFRVNIMEQKGDYFTYVLSRHSIGVNAVVVVASANILRHRPK